VVAFPDLTWADCPRCKHKLQWHTPSGCDYSLEPSHSQLCGCRFGE